MESKKHVLLEKPMTETVSQASLINKIAKVNKCILQIGHLEQFNPAIKKLKSQLKNPEFIEVHRLCKFNPRATDVDVVMDLMIHDIDIVLSLVNYEIKKVSVSGKKVITELIDIANVRIEFKNIDYKFKRSDSLRDEINNFIRACYGKEKPMTTGIEGQKALAVAKKITRNL